MKLRERVWCMVYGFSPVWVSWWAIRLWVPAICTCKLVRLFPCVGLHVSPQVCWLAKWFFAMFTFVLPNNFSPVWLWEWPFRLFAWANYSLQWSQCYGFFTTMCQYMKPKSLRCSERIITQVTFAFFYSLIIVHIYCRSWSHSATLPRPHLV